MEGFVAAMRRSKQPLVGDCWASAVCYYYRQEKLAELVPDSGWYRPVVFMTPMKFMLYGDPTLPPVADRKEGPALNREEFIARSSCSTERRPCRRRCW
jgi:hypothetical protein